MENYNIIFIENENAAYLSLLKSYANSIKFCSWDDLLNENNELDFYWFICEELEFINFNFYRVLDTLENKKPNMFYVNPIIGNKTIFNEPQSIKNKYVDNFDNLCYLIFQSNSSFWIFSGKALPRVVNQFKCKRYSSFYSNSTIKDLVSEDNLIRLNFKFYLKYRYDVNNLKSLLELIFNKPSRISGINKSNYLSFINSLFKLQPRLFFDLFRKNIGLLTKLLFFIDLVLAKLVLFKIIAQIVSIISEKLKKNLFSFLSVFLTVKFFIKNWLYNTKLPIEKTDFNVISLTTYRDRIKTVYVTLESIWNQSTKPSKVILVLSSDEFKSELDLPFSIRKLIKRGLVVNFVKGNLKSYKKLVYTYNDMNVITIDDDIIYPKWWYKKILEAAKANPNTVISYGCRKLLHTDSYSFLPYRSFVYCNSSISSFLNLPIGAYGVFYPKDSLHSDLKNSDIFLSLSPKGDDIWFKAMSVLNNIKSIQIFIEPPVFCHTLFSQKSALYKENYFLNMNDIYIWQIFNYYKKIIKNEHC